MRHFRNEGHHVLHAVVLDKRFTTLQLTAAAHQLGLKINSLVSQKFQCFEQRAVIFQVLKVGNAADSEAVVPGAS